VAGFHPALGRKRAVNHGFKDFQRDLAENVASGSLQEGQTHADLGRACAGLGEAASAVAEGQKAMALTSKDLFEGPKQEEKMAEIYAVLGDAGQAIPILRRLLQIPGGITLALMRLDPIWDQIRKDPRFQELAADERP
jgi:predicted Zn-dependent protease